MAVSECTSNGYLLMNKCETMLGAIEKVDMTPDEVRFSTALSSRLLSFISKQSFAIVESVHGDGLEAWRL